METRVSGLAPGEKPALKPSLVEWKPKESVKVNGVQVGLETFLGGMETSSRRRPRRSRSLP